jgi:pimeloyl-ACP methyl ester carboxylesterase
VKTDRKVTRLPVVVLSIATLIAGCSSQEQSTAATNPSVAASSTSTADGSPAFPPNGSFVVDGGRELFIQCIGSGSPTILLEAGWGSGSQMWPSAILDRLSEHALTCAYDRAGTGRSDPAPDEPRLGSDILADLDALLEGAEVPGPYLLVGTSSGGHLTIYHALQHADRVAGMVVLDSDWISTDPTEDLFRSVLSPAQYAEFIGDGDHWDDPDNVEHIDSVPTIREIEAAMHPLPGMPVRILTATSEEGCPAEWPCARLIERSIELQHNWLTLSPEAVQVLVESGHAMPDEVPDVVISEILHALEDARD